VYATNVKLVGVHEELKVAAARLVILVVFNVLHPQLAPDLNQRTFAHIKLHKHQRCQITLRVVVWKVCVREAEVGIVGRAQDVVCIASILQKTPTSSTQQ